MASTNSWTRATGSTIPRVLAITRTEVDQLVERKYRFYLRGGDSNHPEPDPGRRAAVNPARAWLQRHEEDEFSDASSSAFEADAWGMTLEKDGGATNHKGSFDDLVALALRAGIDEFRVWSTALNDFESYTAATVRPLR